MTPGPAADDGLKLLAELDGFFLHERVGKSDGEWRNLKLIRPSGVVKRNWWLAWNGERLAKGRDEAILSEHDPEIHAWVIRTLST